jgi:hypothetical protein
MGSNILLGNGKRTVPLGSLDVKITIDRISILVAVIVSPINERDLLLRSDALEQLKSTCIDYDEEQASFQLGEIDCFVEDKIHPSFILKKKGQAISAYSVNASRTGRKY